MLITWSVRLDSCRLAACSCGCRTLAMRAASAFSDCAIAWCACFTDCMHLSFTSSSFFPSVVTNARSHSIETLRKTASASSSFQFARNAPIRRTVALYVAQCMDLHPSAVPTQSPCASFAPWLSSGARSLEKEVLRYLSNSVVCTWTSRVNPATAFTTAFCLLTIIEWSLTFPDSSSMASIPL
eukprot:3470009-Rhodomonas_salina.2